MGTRASTRLTVTFGLALVAAIPAAIPAQAQDRVSSRPPDVPVFQWNACPFEGCIYRKWTAEDRVPLFSSWAKSRRVVGELEKGDTVVAVSGVVITYRPGVVVVDRDLPPQWELKRGDRILTYAYHGEGETTAWFKGEWFEAFDITFATYPDGFGCMKDCFGRVIDLGHKEWWAKVKLASGRTAWVAMNDAQFSGVDYYG